MDPTQLLRRVKRDAAADAAAQAEFNEKRLVICEYTSTHMLRRLPDRRMWIPDPVEGFLPGWIKSQTGEEGNEHATAEVVIAGTGEVRTMPVYLLSPMNPPQFDGVEDIADLTHLNEASVVSNLRMRYGAGSIYVSQRSNSPFCADCHADLLRVRT